MRRSVRVETVDSGALREGDIVCCGACGGAHRVQMVMGKWPMYGCPEIPRDGFVLRTTTGVDVVMPRPEDKEKRK